MSWPPIPESVLCAERGVKLFDRRRPLRIFPELLLLLEELRRSKELEQPTKDTIDGGRPCSIDSLNPYLSTMGRTFSLYATSNSDMRSGGSQKERRAKVASAAWEPEAASPMRRTVRTALKQGMWAGLGISANGAGEGSGWWIVGGQNRDSLDHGLHES